MFQQTIGKYQLIEQLGQGGMGTVYRAKSDESKLERDVALKVILPELSQNPEFISRFKDEAQTIADLSPHPHIVQLIDYEYTEEDGAYLVMAFMNGGTLRDWLKQEGTLNLYEIARIYKQICSALARAHKAEIIHRDIKPGNIFLDEDRNAYLGDFGIARHSARTQVNLDVAGTYGYAPPEQIIDDEQEKLTITADIYSAGIVLYECLTGFHPFAGAPMRGLFQSVPALPRNSVDFPDELDAIIAKATKIDALERYSTILALDDALQQVAVLTPTPRIESAQADSQTVIKPEVDLRDFAFISHSSRDDETVERICNYLGENDIDVWVDHRYLESDETWNAEILKRLDTCKDGILVLSTNSLESQVCMAEWRAILGRGKKVYPLVIDEIDRSKFPYQLDIEDFLDLREDFDGTMQELLGKMQANRQTVLSPDFATEVYPQHQTSLKTTIPFSTPPQFNVGITSIVHDALVLAHIDDIPQHPDEFIGRETLLEDIEQALTKKRKVLLQGFGGVGKSTLAAELTARHLAADKGQATGVVHDHTHKVTSSAESTIDQDKHLIKKVLWLQVGSNTGISVLNSLIRALEPSNADNFTKTEDGKPKLRDLIADSSITLVILDDVWSDGQELKSILDTLPSTVSVLVTSRQRYPIGKIIDVDILPLDEALTLLSHHAEQEFDADDEAALALCELLGNHPLALEIAGKTMVVDYLMVEDLLRRIEKAPHLMQMPENYTQEGRESIKSLLDASIAALDNNTNEVFLAYGLFPENSLSPELLAACLGQDVNEIREQLTNLVRRGLAKPKRIQGSKILRFTLHNLAHSYTRTNPQLNFTHAIQGVTTYVDNHIDAMDALDAERNNILKIAEQAQAQGKIEEFLYIMYALTVTSNYLKSRGYDDLLLRLMDTAIETSRERDDKERLHYLLGRRADAYNKRGKYKQAISSYEESFLLADELGLEARAVIVRSVGSRAYVIMKQYDKAKELLDAAEQIAEKLNRDEHKARVLEGRAFLAGTQEDWQTALLVLQEQLKLIEKSHNQELLFYALTNLVSITTELKEFRQAQTYLTRAETVAKDNANRVWDAIVTRAKSGLYHGQGKRAEAENALNQARKQFESLNRLGDVEELEKFMKEHDYVIES